MLEFDIIYNEQKYVSVSSSQKEGNGMLGFIRREKIKQKALWSEGTCVLNTVPCTDPISVKRISKRICQLNIFSKEETR